jgi:hypothetical protein
MLAIDIQEDSSVASTVLSWSASKLESFDGGGAALAAEIPPPPEGFPRAKRPRPVILRGSDEQRASRECLIKNPVCNPEENEALIIV